VNRERPLVTWALAAGILVVSVPTLFLPRLYDVFGGVGRLRHSWQAATSIFEHGWAGVPLVPHLLGNLALLFILGPTAERLLGSARFLAVCSLAGVLYAATRSLTGFDGNGASVVIWSWGPVVWLARRRAGAVGEADRVRLERAVPALWILWLFVPLGMAGILIAGGHGPLLALFGGNAFHISATAAGFAGALLWRGRTAERLERGEGPPGAGDKGAGYAAFLIPLVLSALLAWSLH
jgi:membrane associated rhomboid family serine protease